MTRGLAALCALAAVLAPATAAAEVERFAVLVGNNRGQGDEVDLRYAHADAEKMRDVLLDLGGFRHENVVLMQGADAVAVRQTIVAVNQRIRSLAGGSQAVLLVYYSGHADADALHLGGTELSLRELQQLVGGSAADVRLLIMDSCRSGALTQAKGGRRGGSFDIRLDERLVSQGAIFLTSTSSTEDAQESELLRGSFFTHYLVSGMRGAADASGDGSVNLTEVYRYAYDNTLRASSRTLAGTQHPSFRYALTGHGDFVLTWLEPSGDRRAWFSFPEGRSYLVLQGDADGPVIAEVGMRDRRRTISVHEGRYFIRARGREHLLEGTVTLVAGDVRIVRDRELERIAYARLVRKGEGVLERVHGILFAVRGRSALANSHGMCWGAAIGYALETSSFSVGVRVPYCHSGFAVSRDAGSVDTDVEDLGVEVRLGKPWDVGWGTVEPFVATGGGLMWQRFDTDRVAPDRLSAAVHVDAGAGLRREADSGTFLLLDAAVQTHWFRQAGEDGDIAPSVGIAVSAGLGRWF
ncbi:MAG TPA: caspase family protein [Kofleriaceae bacterium]|nr:caspase family protein [Kofleriaceae bacterium]